MLRSIKSSNRKVRVIAIALDDNGILDCPDKKQVSLSSAGGTTTITILKKFAESPVAVGSAANLDIVDSDTITIDTPTARVDIIIVGKDTAEDY